MRISIACIISCICIIINVFSQNKTVLTVVTNQNLIITDPFGRKTGVDSRYSLPYAQWKWYWDIQHTSIGFDGIGDGSPDYMDLVSFSQIPNCDGIYKIEIIGDYDSTNFMRDKFMRDKTQTSWLSIKLFPEERNQQVQEFYRDIDNIPLERDSVITYLFTYHSVPGSPLSLVKVVSSYTLLQDISAMSKLGWIQSQTATQDYIQLFNTVGLQVSANNISGARTTLTSILNQLHADSAIAISGDACKLLAADVRQYLSELPVIVSVTEQLDTLGSHLQLCYTNGWLGNKQFKEVPEQNIQNAKNKYLRKDTIGCTQELEELQQILRKEYLSRPKKNDKRYINNEAYRLLTSDITNIISNVLTLPPRTSGTIYEQISVLQSELNRAETENRIGGKLLVPALNLMLEVAKKQTQKKDTTGAALQIRLFQRTIQEVYELTQKLKKTKDRIYITATAYISLYYRAEYILEQLTEIRNQPLPKLESELEKELQELRKRVAE